MKTRALHKRVPKTHNRKPGQIRLTDYEREVQKAYEEVQAFLKGRDFLIETKKEKFFFVLKDNFSSIKICEVKKRFKEDQVKKDFLLELLIFQVKSKATKENFIEDLKAFGADPRFIFFPKLPKSKKALLAISNFLTSLNRYGENGLEVFQSEELEIYSKLLVSVLKHEDCKKILEEIQVESHVIMAKFKVKNKIAITPKLTVVVHGEKITFKNQKAIKMIVHLYNEECFFPVKGIKTDSLFAALSSGATDINSYLKLAKDSHEDFVQIKNNLYKVVCRDLHKSAKYYLASGVSILEGSTE
jgi:hypothetical protein